MISIMGHSYNSIIHAQKSEKNTTSGVLFATTDSRLLSVQIQEEISNTHGGRI